MGDHDGHIHKTVTIGTHVIEPRVVTMVFRIKPTRDRTEEGRQVINRTIVRWIDRWATRNEVSYGDPSLAFVGDHEQPDAFACAFLALKVPKDWMCWSQLISEPITGPQMGFPAMLAGLVRLPDLPGTDEEKPDPIH